MNWWERYKKVRVGNYLKFVSPEGEFPCNEQVNNGNFIVGNLYRVKAINKDVTFDNYSYINPLVISEKGGVWSAHYGTFELTSKPIKIYGIVKFMESTLK